MSEVATTSNTIIDSLPNNSNDNWLDEIEQDNVIIKELLKSKEPAKHLELIVPPKPLNDGSIIRFAYIMKQQKVNELSYSALFKQIYIDKKNYAYEWLDAGVVPYFDFDAKNIKTIEEVNAMQQSFWNTLMANITKVFPNVKELNKDFFVMFSSGPTNITANGPFKFSAHVIIRNHGYYENVIALRESGLLKKMDEVMTPFKCDNTCYDMATHGQKMRVVGCYKKGMFHKDAQYIPEDDAHRVLVPVGVQTMTAELFKLMLIQVVAGETLIECKHKFELSAGGCGFIYKCVNCKLIPGYKDYKKYGIPEKKEIEPEEDNFKSELAEEKRLYPELFPKDEVKSDEEFIEYNGQSLDDIKEALKELFERWHPQAKFRKEEIKDGYIIFEYKDGHKDACHICNRNHSSNNPFITYHSASQVAYYKCFSSIEDGKEEKKQVFGKRTKPNEIAISPCSFDRTDPFCWIDFVMKYQDENLGNNRTYDQTIAEFRKDVPRVFGIVHKGSGCYVKKDNCEDSLYSVISELKNTDFDIVYYEIVLKKDQPPKRELCRTSFRKLLKENKSMFPSYSEIVYQPNPTKKLAHQFNTWAGFQARLVEKVDEEKIKWFQELVFDVWAGKNQVLYEYIMNWFAWTVKYPDKLTDTVLFVYGPPGIGKTTVTDFMDIIYGKWLKAGVSRVEELVEKHSSIHAGKKLITLNDVASSHEGFLTTWVKFKDFIDAKRITLNEKYKEQRQIDNFAQYIIFSNFRDGVMLEQNDRRYVCLTASDEHSQDRSYFGNMRKKYFNQDCANHVYTWLMSRDPTYEDVNVIPMTPLKEYLLNLSKSNAERFLAQFKLNIFNSDGTFNVDNCLGVAALEKATKIYTLYDQWTKDNGERSKITSQKFYEKMRELKLVETHTNGSIHFKLSSWGA